MPEWTDAARARLALAAAAADLADTAAALVSTAHEDEHASALEHLTRIEEIAGAVAEVRKLAVIHARERAMPWERIGDALGVTRQTAHARFGAVVDEWHDVLYDPDKHGWAWMPEGAYDPAATAATLDRWLARRHHGDGPAPTVSAGLPTYDPMTRARETLARANWLTRRIGAGTEVSPAAKAEHHRRKDAALTAIADDPTTPPAPQDDQPTG
ncbi:hypothetical protein [Catenuloplanes atrovinosus]|uniref:Uncharacterized protein n=1 Tax=Catenuloplanes atrovinosus TaxID=137266 RepID=A0AAE4CC94_9ACTN|nr:hypothetical protein [Catenuloplanes atrovinosus]MDR7277739.1 hypothetical protein [Catenuloplanes atrovinosus]